MVKALGEFLWLQKISEKTILMSLTAIRRSSTFANALLRIPKDIL